MSLRELVVLGTSSQVPTRHRNHNGYFLRWDGHGLLFDPGEGTQRQLTLAEVPASAITRIFITHFHGDHSLGLASMAQRISLDQVPHAVEVLFPESGAIYYERLIGATIYFNQARLIPHPLPLTGVVVVDGTDTGLIVEALPLDHAVDTLGYRVFEPDQLRFIPERLAEAGVRGPDVGRLEREGTIRIGDRTLRREELSELQPGAVFAFVMDTRPTEACLRLAAGADLLVCEATYLEAEAQLAHDHFHMTARQAAELARDAGARRLVLTHFSQRYLGVDAHVAEARAVFPETVAAVDLDRIPFTRPARRPLAGGT